MVKTEVRPAPLEHRRRPREWQDGHCRSMPEQSEGWLRTPSYESWTYHFCATYALRCYDISSEFRILACLGKEENSGSKAVRLWSNERNVFTVLRYGGYQFVPLGERE
jgi:hypothetical protein